MNLNLTHKKNPAIGWDISASATAEKGEKISRAQISVNGSSKYDKNFNPAISQWKQELNQQGVYPGDNSSQLKVTNDKGDESEADDAWS
jgi:hypothetical protein